MSKTLDEILAGTDDQEGVTAPAATEDETALASSDVVEADTESTETSTPEETTVVTDTTNDMEEKEVIDEAGTVKSEERSTAFHTSVFRAKLIQLNKAATLYANRECTRLIGSYKGIVRQVQPEIDGVALIEYAVVSAGGRLMKRAYIHI